MGQQRNWEPKEIAKLKSLHLNGSTDKQISGKLNRSINAVRIKLIRKNYLIKKCIECNGILEITRGNQLRCEKCSKERTKKLKKIKDQKLYKENKKLFKLKRDLDRFGGIRETVINRDNEKCIECGMTREEHYLRFGCDITVNHIDGNGRNSKNKNHVLDNLETLCLICHGRKDTKRRRKDWSMCGETLKKYWAELRKNKEKSIVQLLQEGKKPFKIKNTIYWK